MLENKNIKKLIKAKIYNQSYEHDSCGVGLVASINGENNRNVVEAGIKALKLEKEIDQIFLIQEIIPSAGQGVIAMQCRDDDSRTIDLLKKVNDIPTSKCALAERDVLRILEGDCETAIGVHALLKDDQITLEAELFSLDGSERFYEKNTKDIKDFDKIGVEIGKILKEKSKGSYKK